MHKKTDTITASLLALAFIAILAVLATRAGFNFDASYNMLSWQSLFDGKGFKYTYNGQSTHFDPVISTGPELYLPTLLVWKAIGNTDYTAASYVLVAYYGAFLVFLLFYVLKDFRYKSAAMFLLLVLFFSNRKLFDYYIVVDPLGEMIAAFLAFAGLYLIYRKEKLLLAFLLLGLALDTKTNIIVALVPTLGILLFVEYLLPLLKKKEFAKTAKSAAKLAALSLLVITPYLVYTKIAPAVVLNDSQKEILSQAQQERSRYMIRIGFGQIVDFLEDPIPDGFARFAEQTEAKIPVLRSYFNDSYLLMTLFAGLLVGLIFHTFHKKHFSFYIFLFSLFFITWWLFASTAPWYRYFVIAEMMFVFSIVSLVPTFFDKSRKYSSASILALSLIIFLPQFSAESVSRQFSNEERTHMLAIKKEVEKLDKDTIFTDGWFQAPQLALLTHKRFQNYHDSAKLEKAKNEYGEIYFLTTIENTLSENYGLIDGFEQVARYGYNGIYRIK